MSEAGTNDLVEKLQQEDIKFLLESDDLFNNVTVLLEDDGNVEAAMDKALGFLTTKDGAHGICAVVMQPEGNDSMVGVLYAPIDLSWDIYILEHRETNRKTEKNGTGKRAFTVATRAHQIIKAHRAGGLSQCFTMRKPSLIKVSAARELNGVVMPLVGYAVRFRGNSADHYPPVKVANPTMTGDPVLTNTGGGTPTGSVGTVVTLACATSGAEVYYTTDMSHPCSQNSAATLYTTPITISEACTLRVRAHKTGNYGSDTVAAKFT